MHVDPTAKPITKVQVHRKTLTALCIEDLDRKATMTGVITESILLHPKSCRGIRGSLGIDLLLLEECIAADSLFLLRFFFY